uniref:Uncharacterized protein n=1 Tax=Helianthus annuus TaxID=4232 RepID=A0A251SV54_HELAN
MHNFGSFIKFFIFLSLIIPTSTLPSSLNVKNIQSVIFSPSLRKLLQDQSVLWFQSTLQLLSNLIPRIPSVSISSMNLLSGSTYIYGLTFFYPYHLYLQFIESIPQVHISLYNLYFIWLKVHQVSGDPASVGT